MRGRVRSVAMTLASIGVVCVIAARHWTDVGTAFAAVPIGAAVACVALHLATLVLRSEAWRVTLASAGAGRLRRSAVHRANAAAFVAGAVQSQAALPARVAMLRRLAGPDAPRAGAICVADVPIFALELCATALLLCAAAIAAHGALWIAPLAAGCTGAVVAGAVIASRRVAHRPVLRGLAVLADRKRRGTLVVLVACIATLTATRIGVVLAACGLPHGLGQVAAVFAALGVFGLLPIGPGAPPSAMLAAAGGAATGSSIAAGLVLGASSIVAVLTYGLLVALVCRLGRRRAGRPAWGRRPDPNPAGDLEAVAVSLP